MKKEFISLRDIEEDIKNNRINEDEIKESTIDMAKFILEKTNNDFNKLKRYLYCSTRYANQLIEKISQEK